MAIWTVKKVKDIILDNLDNVNLLNVDTFEIEFFKKANFFDVAVLEYFEGYKNFINNFKYNGYEGIVILCDFKKGNFDFIPALKTVILDINRLGVDNSKKLIKFLINLLSTRLKNFDFYSFKNSNFNESEIKIKVDVKTEILNKLDVCYKNRFNIIMSIPVFEEGRKVMARGTGYIKELNENYFVVEKIKPLLFSYRLKLDEPLSIEFTDRDLFYQAKCRIRNKTDELVFLDVPESLKIERRRYVRVEPSFKNPVKIYIHIPGEENEILDALDISISGISIISQRDLPVNGVYTFGVKIPFSDKFILCEGIVRNKLQNGESYRYGIECSFTERDIDIIANYIRKREVEILDLLKNGS